MKKRFLSALLTGLFVIAIAGSANATVIVYSNPDLGDHTTDPVSINLSGLAAHTEVTLNFDLFIMDSWDGSTGGASPDYFGFSIDGIGYGWSFDNFGGLETNTDIADATGNFNSVNTWGSIDRYFQDYNDGFTISHSLDTLDLSFYGYGSGFQGIYDESWRVTDLVVQTNATPEPSSIILIGLGLVGLIAARRKLDKK